MKVYVYQPHEIGEQAWPSGTLRFDKFQETRDPAEADVFICPGPLMMFQDPNGLKRFPHFARYENRHVFFDVSDFDTQYHSKAILIRCNLKRWMRESDPNSIPWAWPVEDFKECVELPPGGFKYDVSFHAWIKSEITRELAAKSCLVTNDPPFDRCEIFPGYEGLTCDFGLYRNFTGYIYHEPEGIRRRQQFRRSMKECRVSLCPQSIPGVFPYRFFEAMSAGRVGVLFCDDYNLPYEEEIPWDQVCVRHPASRATLAGPIIKEFLKATSDAKLMEMGLKARQFWEKFLNRDDWPRTMRESVETKMTRMGLSYSL